MKASFTVGSAEVHTITVTNSFRGRERYFVDGVEVASKLNLRWTSETTLHVGYVEKHEVTISVLAKPLRCSVRVDGVDVIENLFPLAERQWEQSLVMARAAPFLLLSGIALAVWAGWLRDLSIQLLIAAVVTGIAWSFLMFSHWSRPHAGKWVALILVVVVGSRMLEPLGTPGASRAQAPFLVFATFFAVLTLGRLRVMRHIWKHRFPGESSPG